MLIVGLGNIGSKYANTRHNAGFIIIDALARKLEVKFSLSKTLHSEIAVHESHVLCKPQTYMNLSGNAVIATKNYYKKDELFVIHDDIDLSLGSIRFRKGGGSGGHNGIKSIISFLDRDFYRLRFGVGKPEFDISDYVLSKFDIDISHLINHSVSSILALLEHDFSYVQNNFTLK